MGEAVRARRRAPRLPASLRREQILDAAINVFARAGYRDASTAAIAAELGVSEPTLFRHFPTKRSMYLGALDRSAETLLSRWQAIAAAASSPLVALAEIGRWYFIALQEDSSHLRLRFRSSIDTGDADVAVRVRQHFRSVLAFVHQLFTAARDAGEIAADTNVKGHAWLFTAIGTLLDVTQMAGLREDLPLEELPTLVALTAPRPGRAIGGEG